MSEHHNDEELEPPTPEANEEADRLADEIAAASQPPAHPYKDGDETADEIQDQT